MTLRRIILKMTRPLSSRILFAAMILILFIAGNSSYAAGSELTLEQILNRVEKHYTGKSFQAEFIQETTIKAMDVVDFASGKIFVRYPGRLLWEYENAEKQIIITDGHKLWVYRPLDNQVLTGSAPAFFSDGKGASFLSDIKLIRQKFRISLENSKEAFFYELMLQPLEKKAGSDRYPFIRFQKFLYRHPDNYLQFLRR